ncbi:MAG: DUF2189 domain-containing protein, partial [Chromatiaceae bacterium]
LSFDPMHRILAQVEVIPTEHPYRWLAAGWNDLRRAPAASIGYGVLFVIASYLITLGVVLNQWFFLFLPLLGGFFLVAPALGLGLYEISRRLENGDRATFGQALSAILYNRFHVATMGAFLAVVLLFWIMAANLIFVGLAGGITPSFANAVRYLFSTENLPMLVVGTLVGAIFALVVFAVSAVSAPMLLDREDVDTLSAMQTSVAACVYNWRPMLLWALLIALVILAGFFTLYVGLAIGFPLVGHATWHAYRDLVKR